MGTFKSKQIFYNVSANTDQVARNFMQSMQQDGYDVGGGRQTDGSWNISIKKGNLFKVVLGLSTALNIRLTPIDPHVDVEVGIGVFGQQAIPSVLTLFVAWPFILPQIWGMVTQSKMDELVIGQLKESFERYSGTSVIVKIIK